MNKLLPFLLLILSSNTLLAQPGFPELVEAAFGSDQELINGIQFSNHYGRIDGHPYFQDEAFREGSVTIANQIYDHLSLRYNLYSQRVEIAYRYANGSLVQFMSVPERMPAFTLEGRRFIRMQFGEEIPAYYQVVSSGQNTCYIGWKKELKIARNNSFNAYQFSAPIINYWLALGNDLIHFHNRKTFLEVFPEASQKNIKRLLKQLRYSFRNATLDQAEAMLLAALTFYETGIQP